MSRTPTPSGSGGSTLIVGDSNMSETTTLLKVGSTDLVLRMTEAGVVLRDMTLDNPIRAIREVSHDMTGRSRVRLANGPGAERARDPVGVPVPGPRTTPRRNGIDPISMRVLEMWERALTAIEDGNLDKIAREIDWVTKYQLIERLPGQARPAAVRAAPLAQLDLAYHDLPPRPGPVLPAAAQRRTWTGLSGTWISSRRKSIPPQTTRAEAAR